MADLLIVALAGICTVVPLWMARTYGLLPLVSPMHFLAYFCAAGFFVKVVVYTQNPDWAFYARFTQNSDASLIGASFLSSFILMMCLGYRCAVRASDPSDGLRFRKAIAAGLGRVQPLFIASFVIAGLTLALILRARGISELSPDLLETLNRDKQIDVNAAGDGATLAGIKSLFIVPKCAFVLLLAAGLAQQDRWLCLQAAIIAGLLVGVGLITGDRFELLELFAYGSITFLMLGGQVRLRSIAIAAGFGAAVLLTSAYMTTLRGSDAGLLYQVVGSTYFLDINASVMIADRMTPATMLHGESYTWWSFGWFPRAYWPDKPAIDMGVYFKRAVMGLSEGGAFNVTGPGEAYINFAWGGICVGFVLGWAYRRIEVGLLSKASTLQFAGFVYYPLFFYPFIQGTLQSSFSAFVVGAAAQCALIFMVLRLCLPRYSKIAPKSGVAYAF